jgi:hypothetical protein
MTEELTTTIYFAWKSVMPDKRQYKQNGTVLELDDTFVAVVIPLTSQYVFNVDEVMTVELDGKSNLIEPILTPAGMRYCIDELEKVMGESELPVDNNSNWETEKKFDTETFDTVSDTPVDDWAAGAEFDEGDAGKADNELWEGNAEDWK